MNRDRALFNRGVAYAVAILSGTHLQPSVAAQIIRESGITLAEFEASGVDATDMIEVRSVFLEGEITNAPLGLR